VLVKYVRILNIGKNNFFNYNIKKIILKLENQKLIEEIIKKAYTSYSKFNK